MVRQSFSGDFLSIWGTKPDLDTFHLRPEVLELEVKGSCLLSSLEQLTGLDSLLRYLCFLFKYEPNKELVCHGWVLGTSASLSTLSISDVLRALCFLAAECPGGQGTVYTNTKVLTWNCEHYQKAQESKCYLETSACWHSQIQGS